MVRPLSIVRYEQLYLASFFLGLIVSALTWSTRAEMLAAQPVLAGQTWPLWGMLILGILVSLALWYFTARSPSAVAKWIVVVFAAFGAFGILATCAQMAGGRIGFGPPVIGQLVVNILYIAAGSLLFRRDALPWFGGDAVVEDQVS